MRKTYTLVGKFYNNIQHQVLDMDGSTILKLIQNIRDERLVTGCMWLDQTRAILNTRPFDLIQRAGTCWITDRVSEYGVQWSQFLGHDLQLLRSGERQSDTARNNSSKG